MTLIDHLDELRTRLIIIIIAVAVASIAGWFLSVDAIRLLTGNVEGKLIYLRPADAFTVRMKISIILGLAFASPVVFHQIWLFVAPGLYPHERRYAGPVIIIAVILFVIGGSFGLFTVPLALNILEKLGGGVAEANLTVDSVVSFSSSIILAFAIVFEMPLVLVFLAKIGVVNHRMLSAGRRYALLIIIIVSAVITPTPDPQSMIIVAVPLYALFEISLFVIRFVRPGKRGDDSASYPNKGGDEPSAGSTQE